MSRCIDGRYVGNELEPLAKPGADIGDLLMVFAANLEYGLEIESEKIFALTNCACCSAYQPITSYNIYTRIVRLYWDQVEFQTCFGNMGTR